jgi:hypothetical protein
MKIPKYPNAHRHSSNNDIAKTTKAATACQIAVETPLAAAEAAAAEAAAAAATS